MFSRTWHPMTIILEHTDLTLEKIMLRSVLMSVPHIFFLSQARSLTNPLAEVSLRRSNTSSQERVVF